MHLEHTECGLEGFWIIVQNIASRTSSTGYVNKTNLNGKLLKKTGRGGKQKSGGPMAHPGPPLELPLFTTWSFYMQTVIRDFSCSFRPKFFACASFSLAQVFPLRKFFACASFSLRNLSRSGQGKGQWRKQTTCFRRDAGFDYEVVSESFETSVPWDRVNDLCRNVKDRIRHECENQEVSVFPRKRSMVCLNFDEIFTE